MNAVAVIFPYRLEGVWVFDDAAAGLVREPFISGADRILDVLTECIPEASNGFKIIFSAKPFPGYTTRFIWTRAEYEGNWYRWPKRDMEGWLCPALLKYFEIPPKEIFVRADLKASEIRRRTSGARVGRNPSPIVACPTNSASPKTLGNARSTRTNKVWSGYAITIR